MRILIVGGGGREHALAWKLSQSPQIEKIFCAPGNAGIASVAECVPLQAEEINKLQVFAREKEVHLTVVGPEAPLMKGITDLFVESGQLIFGPAAGGALLEGSKVWAKEFMKNHGVPTADFVVFNKPQKAYRYLEKASYPLVVKADGLAAGKGVVVAEDMNTAQKAVQHIMEEKAFGEAGRRIIIEEFLEGEEVSVFAITDGETVVPFSTAQDHKTILEGDRGPNTGGMGSYSPAPRLISDLEGQVMEKVFVPLIEGFQEESIYYRGVIYGGLMVTSQGIKVLEFNVRFGDPEAQVLIPRLEGDLFPLLYESARGNLANAPENLWSDNFAVCVVMASKGYPGAYEKGKEISGLERTEQMERTVVFHAGTAAQEGKIVTAGGRVLGVTAWDPSLEKALSRVYEATELIGFEGAYFRRDIAYRALK